MIQIIVYFLNKFLERQGFKTITLERQPPADTHRDHEFSGWYGYLRTREADLRNEPKIHEGADTNEAGVSYYVLSLAFDIQDKIIDIPICLPLPSAITMVTNALKSENFIEELAKASEQLVADFMEEKKSKANLVRIRTSFPGQKPQEMDAPDHIIAHFKKSKEKLPFIELVW